MVYILSFVIVVFLSLLFLGYRNYTLQKKLDEIQKVISGLMTIFANVTELATSTSRSTTELTKCVELLSTEYTDFKQLE